MQMDGDAMFEACDPVEPVTPSSCRGSKPQIARSTDGGGGDRSGETWDDDDLGEGVSGGVSLEVDSLAVPRLPFSTARGGEERRGGGGDRRRQIKVSKQLLHLDKVRPGTGTDGRCQADGTTDFFFAPRCGMEVMDIGNCQGGPSRGRSH